MINAFTQLEDSLYAALEAYSSIRCRQIARQTAQKGRDMFV